MEIESKVEFAAPKVSSSGAVCINHVCLLVFLYVGALTFVDPGKDCPFEINSFLEIVNYLPASEPLIYDKPTNPDSIPPSASFY